MTPTLAIGLVVAAGAAVSGCAAGFAGSPTYVTDTSATINGLVATTDGGATAYWVEYGTETAYDHQSAHRTRTVPGKSSFLVSIPIAGLSPSTTYHYRVCSDRCSDDAAFRTDDPGASRSGIAFFSNRGPGTPFTSNDVIAMDVDGANPVNLTNSATSLDAWPAWSPDARQIAYSRLAYDPSNHPLGPTQIYVMNANGSNKHTVTTDPTIAASDPAWYPHGEQIAFTGVRQPAAAATSTWWSRERWGTPIDLTNTPNSDESNPAWSPDGLHIAYTYVANASSLGEIYVRNVDGRSPTNLTRNSLNDVQPAWSPDGTRIAFTRNVGGTRLNDIFAMDADGGNAVDLTNLDGHESAPSWSPDGAKIAYQDGQDDISVLTLAGGAHTDITNNPAADFFPAWSPRP